MSRLPQYVVDCSHEDRCISKGRFGPITVCCREPQISALSPQSVVIQSLAGSVGCWRVLVRGRKFGRRLAWAEKSQVAPAPALRNKTLRGFTTDYETSVAARRSILEQRELGAGSGLR
jgi:hypothetical protein